ncbi:MAG TPA: N-acetylmuramoyl-L-alanine amidase [Gaiellaceae bacterium]|jgi:N-acetyl-anhydromuramyl-L-alanine amidase AmpD|nr:N-acetylmuramoyl-L-alanine amidase [Gaiellaceae bacterium]
MRVVCRIVIALCLSLALAGVAAAQPPSSRLAAASNFTQADRKPSAIRFIVIHVSEGSFLGTVSWLRNPDAHASANFVVGRAGEVQELVPLHDIAWQAGNWAYNLRSVGIENEGITGSPSGFTRAEYRSSARLAGVIARRSLIPIDRHHIIGHYQVPDPNDPLQGGGMDNHTDPGRYWNWGYFMRLVRDFAYPAHALAHKHVGLQIDSSTLTNKQRVAGRVPWRTKVSGPVHRVAYLVDGRVRWTDRVAPFAFAGGRLFDTFGLRNGKHRLEVRAYGSKSWTRHRFTIRVRNEPFTIAPVSLKAKQQVAGVVSVPALFTGVTPSRVLLYVDGRLVAHDTAAPFGLHWDTLRAKDGLHTLTLAGVARDHRVVRSRVQVDVVNTTAQPAKIVSDSLVDGQTVSGPQHWLVATSGSVTSVVFSIDGLPQLTLDRGPYAYDWDAASYASGTHQLTVQATGLAGDVTTQTLTVTLAAPSAR